MRLLGLDPGLQRTGWGVIDVDGGKLTGIACGTLKSDPERPLADRLAQLYDGLLAVIEEWRPGRAAVEETFVNVNPASTLKLGQARAVSLLVPARAGLYVAEYAAKAVKKAVVGAGAADKNQILFVVEKLLPGMVIKGADAADALAIAICDAHHLQSLRSTMALSLKSPAATPSLPMKVRSTSIAAAPTKSVRLDDLARALRADMMGDEE